MIYVIIEAGKEPKKKDIDNLTNQNFCSKYNQLFVRVLTLNM